MSDLSKLLADISSFYWWIAVVFVGLAINLASAYLKPVLDKFYLQHSDRQQRKIAAEDRDLDIEAGILAKETRLLILKGFEEVRWFVLSVFLLLMAFGLAYLGTAVSKLSNPPGYQPFATAFVFFLSIAVFTLALWAFQRASNITLVLLKTRQKTMHAMLAAAESEPEPTAQECSSKNAV